MTDHYKRSVDLAQEVENLEQSLRYEYAGPNRRDVVADIHGRMGRALKLADIHAKLAEVRALVDGLDDLYALLDERLPVRRDVVVSVCDEAAS